ncbi:MAG: HisA/HisF-related TIM barrel protein, partial [Anaeroglobus sp.]
MPLSGRTNESASFKLSNRYVTNEAGGLSGRYMTLWEEMGAQYLHVVDLDGALQGETKNREAIRSILRAVRIPVELGGGLRSLESVERALTAGIQRVILGSAAVEDPALVQAACERFGDHIVVAIDARDGIVATQGWESSGGVSALAFAKQMAEY